MKNWNKKTRKVLLVALVMMGSCTTLFATDDFTKKAFWEQDKIKHYKISMGIAGTTTLLARYYGNSKFDSFLYGVVATTTIGVIKEIYDKHNPENHTAELGDVYADVLGAVSGSMVTFYWKW